jgi:hypothetical protein
MWAEARPVRPTAVATASAVVVILGTGLALRLSLLAGGQIDYDEGVYWQSLRALAAGHPLFTSVYSSQPPAFLELLAPVHRLAGDTLVAERAAVLATAVIGLVAVYTTAALLVSRGAGLLAMAALAADPLFFRQSVTLQADGPSVCLALAALAAAALARRLRDRPRPPGAGPGDGAGRGGLLPAWLALFAGALLALAVLTKLLAVAALPAVGVMLAAPGDGRTPTGDRLPAGGARQGHALRDLGAAAAGGSLVAAAVLLPYVDAWGPLWRQAVGLHLGAQALSIGGFTPGDALPELPLLALGLAGLAVAARRAPALAAAGGSWVTAAALLLALHRPFWPHHAVVLTAPLALLAGGLAPRPEAMPARRLVTAALALAAIAAWTASFAHVRALQQPPATRAAAVAALRSATAPGEPVVTDDQFTAALAGRSTPPELVDTSEVRVVSGDLTADRVESIIQRDRVPAVLLATGRLDRLPGFESWLRGHFPVRRDLGPSGVLYLRPEGISPGPAGADAGR